MQYRYCLVFFFILFVVPGFGQVQDAQLWTSINLEKKINKTFSLTLSEELRFSDNITELGAYFTDLGLNVKMTKNWRMSANYRFINRQRDDDSYSKRHRFYADLAYRRKIEQLIFNLRTRYQMQYADVNSSATGHIPESYWRNKLTLKYDFDKKYLPYLSAEMFTAVLTDEGAYLGGTRYSAGVEYSFNKRSSLDVFYMIQQEYNESNPETSFVIGLGYYLSF